MLGTYMKQKTKPFFKGARAHMYLLETLRLVAQ